MSQANKAKAVVPNELDGERLDKALAALVPELSRHLARKVLGMGAVTVDGRKVRRASEPVRARQTLEATWHPDVLVPERFDLDVVYADSELVIVDKPSGQLSQGSELGDVGSLIHALSRRFGPTVRLMHRLDKGASGLMVAALTPEASAWLTPQLREHTIERRYVAVTQGVPPVGVCEVPILIRGREVRAAHAGEDGVPAKSYVQVERTFEAPGTPGRERALVAVKLYTGRTHQIRIHLEALGAPIVGDPDYGGPRAPRLCLHAAVLGFVHPNRSMIRFERAPPADFIAASGMAPVPA